MKNLIPSPIEYVNIRNHSVLMERMMQELMDLHKTFLDKHEEIKKIVKTPGPKGDNPTEKEVLSLLVPLFNKYITQETITNAIRSLIPEMKDGKTPTREELISLIESVTPKSSPLTITDEHIDKIASKMSAKSKPAQKIVVDTQNPLSTFEQIMKLPEAKHLDSKYVNGLEQTIHSVQGQLKRYLHGGGISRIAAGSNISIVDLGNGAFSISTSASAPKVPPETPNPVSGTTVFTVVSRPNYVIADGSIYFENNGYTYSAGQITMTNPVTQYIRYFT